MLGYDVDIGHVQAQRLICSKKFSEKKTGYTAMAVMLNEKSELLTMVIQSVKHDLHRDAPDVFQCLALALVANIGGSTMCDALWKDVCDLLTSNVSRTSVRKKACLCLLKLFRKAPENIEVEVVVPKVVELIGDQSFGVATAACSLMIGLVRHYSRHGHLPSVFSEAPPRCIRLLYKLAMKNTTSHNDYKYYHVLSPWLQIKCLRLLQYFPAPTGAEKKRLDECVRKIIFAETTKGSNRNNATHAILFECINLIIYYNTGGSIGGGSQDHTHQLDKVAALLGRFVALKESNVRYLGLDAMSRLAKVPGTLPKIQDQLTTIQYSLHKDLDTSIRKRALDMLFVMCDHKNAARITQELLSFLKHAEYGIREELVLKIAILAERFAKDLRWYIDVILKLITLAGNYVSEDIWYRLIQIVTNNEKLQKYAAFTMYKALQADYVHDNGVKVGGYIIGEFSDQMFAKTITGDQLFDALHKHFPTAPLETQALLLSAYAKLSNAFPELKPKTNRVFAQCQAHADIEIQQRAFEYSALHVGADEKTNETVFAVMPKFPEGKQNALVIKVQNMTRRRSLVDGKRVTRTDADEADDEDDSTDDENQQHGSDSGEDEDESEDDDAIDVDTIELGTFPEQSESLLKSLLRSGTSGYLYKNNVLHIGVKMVAGVSHEMKMKIFYGNISPEPVRDLRVIAPHSADYKIRVSPPQLASVGAKAQQPQFILVECFRPSSNPPELTLSFSWNRNEHSITQLRLPVVASQFVSPRPIDSKKFLDVWRRHADSETKQIVRLAEPVDVDAIEESHDSFAAKLHCSKVDMSGIVKGEAATKSLVLAGVFHAARSGATENLAMPVLARLQFKREVCQITVRTPNRKLSQSIIESAAFIFGQ